MPFSTAAARVTAKSDSSFCRASPVSGGAVDDAAGDAGAEPEAAGVAAGVAVVAEGAGVAAAAAASRPFDTVRP